MNTDLTTRLFEGMDDTGEPADAGPDGPGQAGRRGAPRLRRPDRAQLSWEPWSLEERLAQDHPARTIWSVVERLDLRIVYAVYGEEGNAAYHPKMTLGSGTVAQPRRSTGRQT